jgi:secreted trypsin-like serine protease
MLSLAANASGITRRTDVPDQDVKDLGDTFPSTGFIFTDTGGGGSGVLISPQWILTAAHVVDGAADATVDFESEGLLGAFFGTGYETNQIVIHPDFNPANPLGGGNDLALLHISGKTSASSPPLPTPASLYTGTSEVGAQVVMTGYGYQGTGAGHVNPLAADFTRRGAENLISLRADQDPTVLSQLYAGNAAIASTYLLSDFDDPPAVPQGSDTNNAYYSALDPLPREGSTAPGDSGGPVFANFGNGPQVIGLNTWIDGYFDNTDNASYGDIFATIRVSPFIGWINQVTGIPEPGSCSMVIVVALGALGARRRRRA